MTCPDCATANITILQFDEGHYAVGGQGAQMLRRHLRCESGHERTDDVPVTHFDVTATYPSMDHAAQVTHACGMVMRIDIEQYRGQRAIDCDGCDFVGKVDLREQSHAIT